MGVFKYWLKDQVAAGLPDDELVRTLVTSLGDTARNPASGFWLPVTDFMLNKFDPKAATPMVTRHFISAVSSATSSWRTTAEPPRSSS